MPTGRIEIPTGAIDGFNRDYAVSRAYVAGTAFPIQNGLMKRPGDDDGLVETDPATGALTMREAPPSGAKLLISFLDTQPSSDDTIIGRIPIEDQDLTNDINVIAGEVRGIPFIIQDLDRRPVDLTGCTVYWAVKSSPLDTVDLIAGNSGNPSEILIISLTGGYGELLLTSANTQDLAPGIFPVSYRYDLWVKLPTDDIKVAIRSSPFTVGQRITVVP